MPADSGKADAGLTVVDAMVSCGLTLETLLSDRGYTYSVAEKWAGLLWWRGTAQVIDLHETQHTTRPRPIPGTLYVDGGLFKDNLPKELRKLPGFGLNMSAEQKALLSAKYDERKHYAFTPMGKPNAERMAQRYRDPVLSGTMRCANNPKSLRLDQSLAIQPWPA